MLIARGAERRLSMLVESFRVVIVNRPGDPAECKERNSRRTRNCPPLAAAAVARPPWVRVPGSRLPSVKRGNGLSSDGSVIQPDVYRSAMTNATGHGSFRGYVDEQPRRELPAMQPSGHWVGDL